jgi:hypothetical protein
MKPFHSIYLNVKCYHCQKLNYINLYNKLFIVYGFVCFSCKKITNSNQMFSSFELKEGQKN